VRAYLFVLVVAAAVTYLVTPLVRRIARRIGAITPVRDRDVHSVPVPRLGGVGMLCGFAVAMAMAWNMPFLQPVFSAEGGGAPWGVLLGATAVCALGAADDLWQLDAVTKFAGQAIAAGVMAWKGVQFVSLPINGLTLVSPGFLVIVTVFAVILTINAVNFVDGLDGLAAGIVAIAGSAFFVYSYRIAQTASPTDYSSLATLITAALVGCCLGFLPHNFNPARIFMGDSGSMLIGLLLAAPTIAITGQVDPAVISGQKIAPAFLPLALPLAVLALPLMDLLLAVIRRTRAGQAPWHPDKSHLHHRMLQLGHSHAHAVLILYMWTAILSFGVAMTAFDLRGALVVGAASTLVAAVLTFVPLRGRRARRARARAAAAAAPAPASPPGDAGPDVGRVAGPDGPAPRVEGPPAARAPSSGVGAGAPAGGPRPSPQVPDFRL